MFTWLGLHMRLIGLSSMESSRTNWALVEASSTFYVLPISGALLLTRTFSNFSSYLQ